MQANYDINALFNRIDIYKEPLDLMTAFYRKSGKLKAGNSVMQYMQEHSMQVSDTYKNMIDTPLSANTYVSFEKLNPELEQRILEMIPEYPESEE